MNEINIIKPIELTPEQKEELINLCNKIWPVEFWWIGNLIAFRETLNSYIEPIYWFEFVVRMAIDEERDEFMNFYLNVCAPDETSNT